MADNEIVSKIAKKIREVRLKKNLTIKQLAQRTRLTKGLLSKIENSRTTPSLPVFAQILESLEISFKDFFDEIAALNNENYLVIRKKDQKIKEPDAAHRRNGVDRRRIFSKQIPTSTIDIYVLDIKPGSAGNPETKEGYIFKHVISGTCEFRMNNEVIQLTDGDSLYFNAAIPHVPINRSDKSVLILGIHFFLK